jgi:hypothetical protein
MAVRVADRSTEPVTEPGVLSAVWLRGLTADKTPDSMTDSAG